MRLLKNYSLIEIVLIFGIGIIIAAILAFVIGVIVWVLPVTNKAVVLLILSLVSFGIGYFVLMTIKQKEEK